MRVVVIALETIQILSYTNVTKITYANNVITLTVGGNDIPIDATKFRVTIM